MSRKRLAWTAGACCLLAAALVAQHVRGQVGPTASPPGAANLPRVRDLPPIVTSPAPSQELPPLGAPGLPTFPSGSPSSPDSPAPTVAVPPTTSMRIPAGTPPGPLAMPPESTLPLPGAAPPPLDFRPPSFELSPKVDPKENIVILPEQPPQAPQIPLDPGADLGPAVDAKPGKQEPAVSVEWIAPANARLHQPLPCQIVVKNNGAVTVHQVVVRHPLVPGVTLKASEPQARQENQTLVWDVGTIPAGSFRRIEATMVSSLRGNINLPATVTFSATASHQVQFREPLLQIHARAQERALQGDSVMFAFAVSNPGDGVAENVKVRAMLPEGVDHPRGRSFDIEIGSLAPKESKTLQLPCTARGAGAQHVVLAASADGNVSAQTKVQTEILTPRLDVAAVGPKLRYVERPAHYVVKVTNPGTAPASGVVVTQTIPAGFKFHSASSGGRFDEASRHVVWNVGDLTPGQSRDVQVELIPTAPGDFKIPVLAVSARGAKNEAELHTRVEGLSSLVMEVADTDDPVEVNGETAYEIRVLNAGTKVETNVELTCTLPDQAEFKDARCIAGVKHRVEGRTVIFEPAARLAPRADLIYRVVVRGKLPGDGRFRAQVRAEGMTEAVQRDETTRFYRDDLLPR